jgi:hypothetical protein
VKLIIEEVQDVQYLTEDKGDGKKNYFIVGKYLQSEVGNRNGRWYPSAVMEREASRYVKEKIDTSMSYGELGHPNGPGINLDRVSHITKSLVREGNDWVGKAQLVDTPNGNIARNLLECGGRLGVSSRGIGTLKPDKSKGLQVVQDDFRLCVAADIVADPSAPDAFVKGIMEGTEFQWDENRGWIQQIAADTRQEMARKTVRQIEEDKLQAFSRFLAAVSAGIDLEEKRSQKPASTSDKYLKARAQAAREGKLHDAEYIRRLAAQL